MTKHKVDKQQIRKKYTDLRKNLFTEKKNYEWEMREFTLIDLSPPGQSEKKNS